MGTAASFGAEEDAVVQGDGMMEEEEGDGAEGGSIRAGGGGGGGGTSEPSHGKYRAGRTEGAEEDRKGDENTSCDSGLPRGKGGTGLEEEEASSDDELRSAPQQYSIVTASHADMPVADIRCGSRSSLSVTAREGGRGERTRRPRRVVRNATSSSDRD